MTTAPAGAPIAATLEEGTRTPTLWIHLAEEDPAPYIHLGEVQLDDPETWPSSAPPAIYDPLNGVLPRHRGPTLVVMPSLRGHSVGAILEFASADAMEALAGVLTRAAAQRRAMHDPAAVLEAVTPELVDGEPWEVRA